MSLTATRSVRSVVRDILVRNAMAARRATPLVALLGMIGGQVAHAQTAAPAAQPSGSAAEAAASEANSEQVGSLETVVVSGSRIVRDGYNSPTPVSVIGTDVLQHNATSNVADAINNMPNFLGSSTPETTAITVTSGQQAINGLNIGGLGTTRTLVLVNGQRTVGSTLTGVVDISELPQQLITRVDVVTGGASAGYGSDALTGIVNFVLDTKFTGVKAEVSGGETNYGDDRNWRANITAGTGFAGNRGHLEVSGELDNDDGVLVAHRPWNNNGTGYITNPNYKPGNGQPLDLLVNHIGVDNASYGGTIASGPFRGTMFGPGGVQSQETFGNIVSDPLMSGGSWASQTVTNVLGAAFTPHQSRQNAFARLGWDLNDNAEIYTQASYGHLYSFSDSVPVFYPSPGGLTIQATNPFLPANIASGLAADGVTSFKFGSFFGANGSQHPITDRQVNRFLLGGDGKFDVLGSTWTWDAYASYGISYQQVTSGDTINVAHYLGAIDAVLSPTGAIVCRSTLTAPNNGCVPLNLFGTNVASRAAINYVTANPFNHAELDQQVESANLHGSPFNDWAGPVSFAFGAEHRREATSSHSDPGEFVTGTYFLAAGLPYRGSFSVTEGYIETEVPLLKDLPFAKSFDLNAAVRETGYNTFGTTRTWKVGLTWSVVDDLRFRATRSLDIREPTLVDLYQAGTVTSNAVTDPFNGNATVAIRQITTGNPKLVPERADNFVVGAVFQPTWAPRWSTSVDYYDIHIDDGITSFSAQQIINLCFNGSASACNDFTRGTSGGVPLLNFSVSPLNFATETARRLEIESTYLLPMQAIHDSLVGQIGLHTGVTHYITDVINSGAVGSIPIQNVGVNASAISGSAQPRWKFTSAVDYSLEGFDFQLTMRGISSGVYSNSNIQCLTACPTSTANNVTVSDNHIAGAIYFDLGTSYKFQLGQSNRNTEVFFNVRNLLNKNPPIVAMGPGNTGYDFFPANQALYDILGAEFRLGVRAEL